MHPTFSRIAGAFALAGLLLAADCIAQAQGNPDDVLAENALTKLTRFDYETWLLSVPPDARLEIRASPKRLTTLLNTLLIDKTLAQEARNAGVDRDPEIQRRLAQEIDRFYAQAMLAKVERDAAAEFDKNAPSIEAKARETYLINKSKYMIPEQISASHILFDTKKRGDAAAEALAAETRAKLAAGADFATLAKQLSDDPTVKQNGGTLGWFVASMMDPAFSKAAFALNNVGDLSAPVQSSFGWHVIRLDGKRPAREMSYEQAKRLIMSEMRQRYIKEARDAKIDAINKDPNMKVNQALLEALVVPLPEAPKLPRTPPAVN
jgi:peptidyl-prolyl cis-trans isomerase C